MLEQVIDLDPWWEGISRKDDQLRIFGKAICFFLNEIVGICLFLMFVVAIVRCFDGLVRHQKKTGWECTGSNMLVRCHVFCSVKQGRVAGPPWLKETIQRLRQLDPSSGSGGSGMVWNGVEGWNYGSLKLSEMKHECWTLLVLKPLPRNMEEKMSIFVYVQ